MGKELILVLGGARAGKSAFAQKLAQAMGPRVLCVATAEPSDEEMRRRIQRHRQRRPRCLAGGGRASGRRSSR